MVASSCANADWSPGLLPVGNKLYVVGGRTGRWRANHEVYDALTGRFCCFAPTSMRFFPFKGIHLMVSGSKILVHRMKAATDEVASYDVAMNEWQTTVMKMEACGDDFTMWR